MRLKSPLTYKDKNGRFGDSFLKSFEDSSGCTKKMDAYCYKVLHKVRNSEVCFFGCHNTFYLKKDSATFSLDIFRLFLKGFFSFIGEKKSSHL